MRTRAISSSRRAPNADLTSAGEIAGATSFEPSASSSHDGEEWWGRTRARRRCRRRDATGEGAHAAWRMAAAPSDRLVLPRRGSDGPGRSASGRGAGRHPTDAHHRVGVARSRRRTSSPRPVGSGLVGAGGRPSRRFHAVERDLHGTLRPEVAPRQGRGSGAHGRHADGRGRSVGGHRPGTALRRHVSTRDACPRGPAHRARAGWLAIRKRQGGQTLRIWRQISDSTEPGRQGPCSSSS